MKVVFPRSGSLVLLKEDLETLKAFYKTNLMNSKMSDIYPNASTVIQVNNFNYFPKSNALVLHDANVLTIAEMRKILGLNVQSTVQESAPTNEETEKNVIEKEHDYISDNDLLSNPFFTTLTPIN